MLMQKRKDLFCSLWTTSVKAGQSTVLVCVLCLLQAGKVLNSEVQTSLGLGVQEGTLKLKLR